MIFFFFFAYIFFNPIFLISGPVQEDFRIQPEKNHLFLLIHTLCIHTIKLT